MNHPTISTTQRAAPADAPQCSAFGRLLGEIFEGPFQFACLDREAGAPDEQTQAHADQPPHLQRILADASRRKEPHCVRDDQAQAWLLAIPFEIDGRTLVAFRHFPQRDAPALLRLARSAVREHALREQVASLTVECDSLVSQVTEDFEELHFLRRVVGLLALSDENSSLTEIGHSVAGMLRESIRAECVLFLTRQPAQADGDNDDRARSWQVLSRAGPPRWTDRQCTALIQSSGQCAVRRPLVRNHLQRAGDASHFSGVDQLILVPVLQDDQAIGWLLALNRSAENDGAAEQFFWQQTQREFGSPEVSVMSSAATTLATHAQNLELFRQKEQLLTDLVRALVNAIDAKDHYTRGHSERVALFARQLGRAIGLDGKQCQRIYLAGLLHDVGKLGLGDGILNGKRELTDEELTEVQLHPERGWQVLFPLEQLRDVIPGVLHHHECCDGSGYPDRLTGDAIPLDARILAICDTYDAMTSDRSYRKGLPQHRAEAILQAGAGTQWDPPLVEAFLAIQQEIVGLRDSYRPSKTPTRRPLPTAAAPVQQT